MPDSTHRVCLLGPLRVMDSNGRPIMDDEGEQYEPTSPRNSRLLITLALRAGELVRSAALIRATWEDEYRDNSALQTPVANLRHLVPIPKQGSMEDGYRLSLDRNEIDALDFIDSAPNAQDPAEINRLLDLWREDPIEIHEVYDRRIWERLDDALINFLARIEGLDPAVKGYVRLEDFYKRLPHRRPLRVTRPRVLIVDDHPGLVSELQGHLSGFECIVATTLPEALSAIEREGASIDAAVVDLHLTPDMESHGLAVLTAIKDNYPAIPRVLLTRTPMVGEGMREQIEKFGLFNLITKKGESTPYTIRATVEEMMGTSASARRRRLRALLNSHGTNLDRLASRAQRTATKAHRARPGDEDLQKDFVRAASQRADYEEDLDELRTLLEPDDFDVDEAEKLVEAFLEKWRARLQGNR